MSAAASAASCSCAPTRSLAALGARAAGRPVKLAIQRPLMPNNSTHRPATRQHIRIGAAPDGTILAIAHESGSGDLPHGKPETATSQTKLLYAGANRLISMRLAELDLPEGNAMRAPGEAPGLMALEIAMDEMAEKLGMDPIAFRVKNDTQVDPEKPERRFSAAAARPLPDRGGRTLRLGRGATPGRAGRATAAGWSASALPRPSATTSTCLRARGCGWVRTVSSPSRPT